MINILGIGFACGIGALCRYILSFANRKNFPWGTLISNLFAAFLIGFFSQHLTDKNLNTLLSAGFLGGLGTYATLNYEFAAFFSKQSYAFIYYSLTYGLGLFLAYIGMSV
ncbi:CrcB family protein [Streptococcus sp. H49]|uniref:CrcB family protein n=1 Tax=Streptococcus huangxiaojuni TaxID=3237239 RepID=UPI0034A52933